MRAGEADKNNPPYSWEGWTLPLASLGDVKECSGTLNWTDYKEPLSLSATMGMIIITTRWILLNRYSLCRQRWLSTLYHGDPLDSLYRTLLFQGLPLWQASWSQQWPGRNGKVVEWKSSTLKQSMNKSAVRYEPAKPLHATMGVYFAVKILKATKFGRFSKLSHVYCFNRSKSILSIIWITKLMDVRVA